ncbi:MAG: DUF349 domain-containing protein [Bacteroidales bacterium]|nr:DUF349 domain-containing protein [Bacteroidales bacterium]MDT3356889.1 DUF349 domain-containing protein [Bacteroidota bacterium]
MSDEKNPEVAKTSDVAENAEVKNTVENVIAAVEEVADQVVNYAEKSLSELTSLFDELMSDEARMKRIKEAEAIKAAFYKRLSKEKEAAGFSGDVEVPGEEISAVEQVAEESAAKAETDPEKVNPFEAIESGFKSLYNKFRKERAEYNRQLDEERAGNLVKKNAVVDELKALVEKQEDVSASFPEFRALQARWREIGPVPQTEFRNLNDTYQFYVEKFYDKVQINRDMRDLDFKKNLEAKEKFCEQAEELAASDNVVESFKELQKLHEQWKELGPVAKEFRESIWERFKAATAVINRKYQAYFEEQKGKQVENLAAKSALCEKVEAIADKAEILTSNEWNSLSKEIEDIQKEWRTIGFATRKENQKIYDRFRAACDKFFERKRVFYSEFKNSMNENLEKKMALIEEAEKLKTSTDWKKTTELFIELQKKWKEIGAVPRKKSEVIWKRFRAACDEFFTERDKNAKPENDFYGNLKAKKALVDEIKAFVRSDDEQVNSGAYQSYTERWNAIGFVPFKEKDSINQAYREAMQEKFPDMSRGGRKERAQAGRGRGPKAPVSEKDRLVQQYNKLQQEIETYENNIGFFAESKNAAPLIRQMQEKIEGAKEELKSLEQKIREIEDAQEQ